MVEPDEGEAFQQGYYAGTIVAYNPRTKPSKGRWLVHLDDGMRERIDFPEATVRIMTTQVTQCSCRDSPGGQPGCCRHSSGSEELPHPWEADPK